MSNQDFAHINHSNHYWLSLEQATSQRYYTVSHKGGGAKIKHRLPQSAVVADADAVAAADNEKVYWAPP